MVTKTNNINIIRINELASLLGVSRTTLWRMEKDRELPSRINVSQGVSGWLESDIKAWLENHREHEKPLTESY
jgi:predicted DNA-binding transcriptional regulator AlpA